MDWNGIVNARADTPAKEVFFQCVPLLGANHIEMPDRFGACHLARKYDVATIQELVIESRVPAACGIPLFQVFQLNAQNGGLQSVEPSIEAAEQVLIFFLLSVIAQHFQTSCDPKVICDDHTAVAVGPQVFPRIEAESRCMPQ